MKRIASLILLVFMIWLLLQIFNTNVYAQYNAPKENRMESGINAFMRYRVLTDGVVNGTSLEIFSEHVRITNGFAWQLTFTCDGSCDGRADLYASADCNTYAPIKVVNNKPEMEFTEAGTMIVNVAQQFYNCSKIVLTNNQAVDLTVQAWLTTKEGL